MELTAEQRDLVEMTHEFAEREMRPVAAHYEETEEFPWPVVRKAAELGLTCYDLPEQYGGGGVHGVLTAALIVEELSWGDSAIHGCISGGQFFAGPIVALGTEEQRQRWLPPLCAAEPVVGALATTEPQAGSDAASMLTLAEKVDGGYRINGQKTWISNAPTADSYIVFAQTRPGARSKGITAFVLEKGAAGFEIGRKLPKMGCRCYPAAELFFTDCFVADDQRVGDEGQGFYGLMKWFDHSRVTLGANAVGIGRAALEFAVDYAKEREQFGSKIHEFQAVSFRLVDAKMKLDQARLMTHHAARLADAGKPFSVEAAQAKLAGSEAAWYATWAAMQTLGGYSYSREYPVERWLRAAKLEELYEGTSDIQRLVIARSMFR
jgi:acyl-CoA dehydrogenase